MSAGWYVLHVFSGYENKIEKTIRMLITQGDLDANIVRDIKIPTEEVTDVKDGKKRTMVKKFFPGYMLAELDFGDHDWKATCQTIRQIQGVTGFVGSSADKKPQPLSADEARAILQRTGELKGEKPVRTRQSFSAGEQVKITGGPFESFTGTIEEVNNEKNKLKVMVGIFGRNTPVEVDIVQVEKV
ncbi:transcription termination/antitermination protein NusG [Spirochaetia bacterium]|nr:transcription termination/antitermination protein NusG [Spirochaetia bacterium]GHV20224.1 transcription termination/antitermination protein NusG [Spirochaetia bacterium]